MEEKIIVEKEAIINEEEMAEVQEEEILKIEEEVTIQTSFDENASFVNACKEAEGIEIIEDVKQDEEEESE